MNITKEKIEYFRKNPVMAAKILLNVNLNWYQVDMLETAWFVPNTIWLACRGAAKTYVAATFLLLKCLLYKNVKCGVVSGAFPQACITFEKIKDIYHESPILQQEMKGEPKINKDSADCYFKNNSWISAFPIIGTRKGLRKNIIFMDEYRQIKNIEEAKSILNPMLNCKHKEIRNQLLIASTASYEGEPYDLLVREYRELQANGNKDFAVCDFDVHDALTGGFLDPERVETDRLLMLPDEFALEYLNEFVSLRDGWIKGESIRECELDYKPQLVGNSEREAIIGADVARTDGGDNSAFTVLEIWPDGVRLVRVVSLNGEPYHVQATVLKQLCRDFNVIKVVMDHDSTGKALRDELSKPTIDPDTGELLCPIVPEEDTETPDAKRIIKNINFRNKDLIWGMGITTKKAIQDKKLFFPKDDYRIILTETEELNLSQEERKAIQLSREIQEIKKEMTMVKVKPNETQTSFSFIIDNPKKNKKDRFMSLILGASEAIDYYKELNEYRESGEFIGCWG